MRIDTHGPRNGSGQAPSEPQPVPRELPGDKPPVQPAEPVPGQREPNADPIVEPIRDPTLPDGSPGDPQLPQPHRAFAD
ncbi:MAG: hypothetical protein ABL904_20070 [Hyphomicrobiaceae bacterium]